MKLKFVLIHIFLVLSITIKAQVFEVNGVVIDSVSRHGLSFVNIVINDDGTFGTATDIDGRFTIKSNKEIYKLTCSYVGYNTKSIDIKDGGFNGVVLLTSNGIELDEVIVDARNNPANRVIDSVSKYRDKNNIYNIPSYSYTIYDRMIFTFDTLKITDNDFMDITELVRDKDIITMETVSDVFHRKPHRDKRNIKASIVSGMSNSEYFYLLDKMQSFNLYDDNIIISQIKYLNPITPGNKSRYFFNLESAIPTADNDTVFTISFIPRRNAASDGLKGILTVHSDSWAVINIKAEPYDKNVAHKVKIQQFYEKINDTLWFPKQLNTNLTLFSFGKVGDNLVIGDKEPATSKCDLIGVGKSFVSDIKINEPIDNHVFKGAEIDINDNGSKKDNVYWSQYRNDGIEARIINTHSFIDSIMKIEHINLDRVVGSLKEFGERQSIPIGFVNLNLNGLASYHKANKLYLGLGLFTNDKLSKSFSVSAWGGYFPARKKFNYGGGINFFINKKTETNFKLYASRHYSNLGHYGLTDTYYKLFNVNNFKFHYVRWTTINDKYFAELSSRFLKIFKASIGVTLTDINDYNDNARYMIPSIDVKMLVSFGERNISSSKGLRTVSKGNPTIWLSGEKGISGILGGEYDFYRLQAQLNWEWKIPYLGKSSLIFQAGHIIGDVPTPALFGIYGNNNIFALYSTACFSTMLMNEFFCDKFASLFFSHNFGKMFTFKRLSPDFIFETNIGIGGLETQRTYCGETLKSIDKGYFESGIMIDNIIKALFVKVGFGVFYRYGAYSFDKTADNFAYKLKISITK
ncbi:MAG: DUF5686 family protein [Candidatus Limimorpha sp.]